MVFVTFPPVWQTSQWNKALKFFFLLDIHPSLPETTADRASMALVRLLVILLVRQLSVIILEVSTSRAASSAMFVCVSDWFPQQLKNCWVLLKSTLTVYRLSSSQSPNVSSIRLKCSCRNCHEPPDLFPPQTWVDSPPPQPSPTWLLRLKIAPAVLLCCVLGSLQLRSSLRSWWMPHCFSSQCFSKLLWECIKLLHLKPVRHALVYETYSDVSRDH